MGCRRGLLEVTRSLASFRGPSLVCPSCLLHGRKSSGESEHNPRVGSGRQDCLYSWVPTPVWVGMLPSSRPGAQLREGAAEKGFREAGPSSLCGVTDHSWVLPACFLLKVWTSPGRGGQLSRCPTIRILGLPLSASLSLPAQWKDSVGFLVHSLFLEPSPEGTG